MSKIIIRKLRPRSLSISSIEQAARIGVHNRYKYDYACEDEYFEKEMTLLEARKLPLPLPVTFRHKQYPMDEIMPAHWNDVRFNFKP